MGTTTKPTADDLTAWLKLESDPSEEAQAVYEVAIETAIEYIESRVTLPEGTTDDTYPVWAATSILLAAARLQARSDAVQGTTGFGSDGAVMRLLRSDPDIENLIMLHKNIGFA